MQVYILRKDEEIPGVKYVETRNKKNVFEVNDLSSFNAIIGAAKHKNSSGTVLYRGQCKLYDHLIPSIKHNDTTYENNKIILIDALEKMYRDKDITDFFDFNEDVEGWELYIKTTLEAALQHYGAKTRSVDFVDNHWTALWFALNEYDSVSCTYHNRAMTNTNETEQYGYIILYLAETNVPEVNGLYLGSETYTIDLRKSLPPSFLRPLSQHGWIVTKKEKKPSKKGSKSPKKADDEDAISTVNSDQYVFDDNVVGIVRIKTSLINKMLGDGSLLSQNNFFPSPEIDTGYAKLLTLEGNLLAKNMLEKYHGANKLDIDQEELSKEAEKLLNELYDT